MRLSGRLHGHQHGQPVGSTPRAEIRYASVTEWANNSIVRVTSYTDIDEARAAAELLTQERAASRRSDCRYSSAATVSVDSPTRSHP
jgi:hypothetical protein